MSYHLTRYSAKSCIPAELLFGQRLRTASDVIKANLANKMESSQNNMINKGKNRRMLELKIGKEVFIHNFSF